MSEADENEGSLSFNFADFLEIDDDELEENQNAEQFLNEQVELELIFDQEDLPESFDQTVWQGSLFKIWPLSCKDTLSQL